MGMCDDGVGDEEYQPPLAFLEPFLGFLFGLSILAVVCEPVAPPVGLNLEQIVDSISSEDLVRRDDFRSGVA